MDWAWPWLRDITSLAFFSAAMSIALYMFGTFVPKMEKEDVVALRRGKSNDINYGCIYPRIRYDRFKFYIWDS